MEGTINQIEVHRAKLLSYKPVSNDNFQHARDYFYKVITFLDKNHVTKAFMDKRAEFFKDGIDEKIQIDGDRLHECQCGLNDFFNKPEYKELRDKFITPLFKEVDNVHFTSERVGNAVATKDFMAICFTLEAMIAVHNCYIEACEIIGLSNLNKEQLEQVNYLKLANKNILDNFTLKIKELMIPELYKMFMYQEYYRSRRPRPTEDLVKACCVGNNDFDILNEVIRCSVDILEDLKIHVGIEQRVRFKIFKSQERVEHNNVSIDDIRSTEFRLLMKLAQCPSEYILTKDLIDQCTKGAVIKRIERLRENLGDIKPYSIITNKTNYGYKLNFSREEVLIV